MRCYLSHDILVARPYSNTLGEVTVKPIQADSDGFTHPIHLDSGEPSKIFEKRIEILNRRESNRGVDSPIRVDSPDSR